MRKLVVAVAAAGIAAMGAEFWEVKDPDAWTEKEVARLDPEQPLAEMMTLRETLDRGVAHRRFASLLLGSFAGLALLLALVGVYGVAAYSVARRTGEMGLRLALGASRLRLLRQVLAETARSVLAGVAFGLAGALGLTRLLSRFLFETSAREPATLRRSPLRSE